MKKIALIFSALAILLTGASFLYAKQNTFNGLIVSWESNTQDHTSELQIRTRSLIGWSKWQTIEADEDSDEVESSNQVSKPTQSENLFNSNQSFAFEYRVIGETDSIKNIKIEPIFSNREGEPRLLVDRNPPRGIQIISRKEWGADESLTYSTDVIKPEEAVQTANGLADQNERSEITQQDPEIDEIVTKDSSGKTLRWPLQYAKDIKFMVVHHTASVNDLEKPKTAIQNILYYHAVKRGWGDIGYNYLIDPNGNIYEGRKGGPMIIGGHSLPLNKVSIGIALLGNFEDGEVPAKTLESLLNLTEQIAKKHKINVDKEITYKEKKYLGLHGHGDNSATKCPGHFIKRQLDAVRETMNYQTSSYIPLVGSVYDYRDLNNDRLIVVPADEEKSITIKLKNSGQNSWRKDTYLRGINGGTDKSISNVVATLSEEIVRPGKIGIFKGNIPRNLVSGLRVAQTRLVVDGTNTVAKSLSIPIFVEGVKATYEIVDRKDPPKTMRAGARNQAWIVLKNTGNITWTRSGKNKINIGTTREKDRKSAFFNDKIRIGRMIEQEVKPGETGKFIFNLKAPQTPGKYEEYFAPLIEDIMWMSDNGLHFTVDVRGDEKQIKILLRDFDKPKVSLSSDEDSTLKSSSLIESEKKIVAISSNSQVIIEYKNKEYIATIRGKEYFFKDAPRMKAKKGGIITINNYNKHPAWNPSLNDNMFEGTIEVRFVDDKLSVINELPLESYLKGIAEVSNGDPQEKIRTLIILARSYARYHLENHTKFPNKPYDLDNDPDSTQKYLGYGLKMRSPNISKAVDDTRGLIVTYLKKLILTPYFSQSDGRTRSAQEVWGWTDKPYLQSVNDSVCGATKLLGHGVGLSGCGATALAKKGKTYEEIIKYYYKGVELDHR